MRIGIVAPEFPPDVGGVETYAYEFCVELARRGHAVFVFTRPHVAGEVVGPGFQVLPELKLQYLSDRLLPKKFYMDAWHVLNAGYAWLALETQPVIVSVHGNDFINPYLLPMHPNLSRLPSLWRLQTALRPLLLWVWRKLARRLMWRGLSRARQVIVNSEFTKNLLIKYCPRCKGSMSVGYVGVGDDFLRVQRRRGGPVESKRLVTVCRLGEPRKNVDKVLQALAQMKQYPFKYTVVGDGSVRPKLESLCRQLDLEDRVNFTGYLPKTDVQNLLAESDLFILTSAVLPDSVEGFGIVYLEANACGTPVLAARDGGAVEAVEEGKTGYFVDEPSVPAIAAALERFLKSEVTFKSENCQAFARRFTWARVVDHAVRSYDSPARDLAVKW